MKTKELSIAAGNTKLGKVYNISVPPIKTCPKNVPCQKQCYALKAWNQYPRTRKAWTKNYEAYKQDPDKYFNDISELCKKKKIERFRWHVGGDIESIEYFNGMKKVAEENPNVHFLAFTKNIDLIQVPRPTNLKLVVSMWPKLLDTQDEVIENKDQWIKEAESYVAFAWMIPETTSEDPWYNKQIKTKLQAEGHECHGHCDECFLCWHMGIGNHVLMNEH